MRDVIPGVALGGLAIMLDGESTPVEDRRRARDEGVATERSLGDAVDRFLRTLPAQSH